MEIIHMEEVKKMFKTKYIILSLILSVLFFSHSVFAINYGSGQYGDSLYSATIPGVVANPASGTYDKTQYINLSSKTGNTIKYSFTTTPINCSTGTLYINPIEIKKDTKIYTLTCDIYGNSTANVFNYIIKPIPTRSGSTIQNKINNQIGTENTPSNPLLTKILKQGITDPEVKILQIFLNKNGYTISSSGPGSSGSETNYFGLKTKQALMLFQKTNGLTADGIVGPKTIDLIKNNIKEIKNENSQIINNLSNPLLTKILKQGITDPEVKILQIFLNKNGYTISSSGPGSSGSETNYFGLKTKQALMLFQKTNGLTADGIVGPKTIDLINNQ